MQTCSRILKGYLIVEVIFPTFSLLKSNRLRMGLVCSEEVAAGNLLVVVGPHVVDSVLDHLHHHSADGVVAGVGQSSETKGEVTGFAVGAINKRSENRGRSIGLLDFFLVKLDGGVVGELEFVDPKSPGTVPIIECPEVLNNVLVGLDEALTSSDFKNKIVDGVEDSDAGS